MKKILLAGLVMALSFASQMAVAGEVIFPDQPRLPQVSDETLNSAPVNTEFSELHYDVGYGADILSAILLTVYALSPKNNPVLGGIGGSVGVIGLSLTL